MTGSAPCGVKAAGAVINDALIVGLFSAVREVVSQEKPDVVVSPYPHYQAPLHAVLGLERRKIPLVTVVTDYANIHQAWFHPGIDLCLVPSKEARESLACGLPPLYADVMPGQEQGNVDYVVEHGAGDVAESPLETLEILCHWLENDGALLAERTESARQLGRPRAALDAAELIWEVAEQADGQTTDRSEIEELLSRLGISWRGSEEQRRHRGLGRR